VRKVGMSRRMMRKDGEIEEDRDDEDESRIG
jgi:hypothetical protein